MLKDLRARASGFTDQSLRRNNAGGTGLAGQDKVALAYGEPRDKPPSMSDRLEVERNLRNTFAVTDPLGTELDLGTRLDEYLMEAADVARRICGGESLESAVTTVFDETAEVRLDPDTVCRIRELYDGGF